MESSKGAGHRFRIAAARARYRFKEKAVTKPLVTALRANE
jgi:hypothetical protein